MTPEEQDYRDRSKRMYQAGIAEENEEMREVLLEQSVRLAMKAITIEVQRKQEVLKALGIPTRV